MIFKAVFAFAVFATVITISSGLNCYVCAGTFSSDCSQGKRSATGIQHCNNLTYSSTSDEEVSENEVDSRLQAVCLKFTPADVQPNLVIRECGYSPANVDPCDYLKQRAHVKTCKACKTDRCNAGIEDPVVEMMF